VFAVTFLLVGASLTGVLPVQLMRVQSGSMSPALDEGDLVLLARDQDIERRDVVAVRDPLGGGLLVKRAVGVGGDSVAIEDGVLVINGAPVCEAGIDPARIDGVWFGPVEVEAGEVFVLGDERDGSVDSRAFGAVRATDIVGYLMVRAWPSPGVIESATC
jgi:signal peptidase I